MTRRLVGLIQMGVRVVSEAVDALIISFMMVASFALMIMYHHDGVLEACKG
jgi:hypothetical protein